MVIELFEHTGNVMIDGINPSIFSGNGLQSKTMLTSLAGSIMFVLLNNERDGEYEQTKSNS